jgi:cystathionine beta-synthase
MTVPHGTTGTRRGSSGDSRFLKEKNPKVRVIGVDPYGSVYHKYWHTRVFDESEVHPYITEGVGEDILAGNMDFDMVDDYVRVTDREAMQVTRRLAREEGLFLGGSSGMAMAGALQWLHAHSDKISADDVVVVLMPDSGFRYLSKIYNDNWMQDHGFLEKSPDLTVGQILSFRRRGRTVIHVSGDDTLAEAIRRMSDHGISQMPVMEDGEAVGSLTESGILNLLITHPDAREKLVRAVMSPPLPVVSPGIHLEQLYSYLDTSSGAVMVQSTVGSEYEIITRSDLIRSLAEMGRNNIKNGN